MMILPKIMKRSACSSIRSALLFCFATLLLVCQPVVVVVVDAFQHETTSSLSSSTAATTTTTTTLLSASESSSSASSSTGPRPIDPIGWPERFPAKKHCSKCGLCETSFVSYVHDACAFLNDGMSRIDECEEKVHGRRRNLDSLEETWSKSPSSSSKDANNADTISYADEARFGVLYDPMRLVRGVGIREAQWTGVVTGISLSMLESNQVDAVVCISSGSGGGGTGTDVSGEQWSFPVPIIAKTPEDVLKGRGVKPSLAPSLSILDEIKNDPSIKRLLFCGVGCSVQAFRAVQDSLNLEKVYVLGTNCVDNSPTPEAAESFIRDGFKLDPDEVPKGYEFMQDFRIHVKTVTGEYFTKPYFSLPGSIAEPSIATSCLACSDYTNALADVVVGYMGAPLEKAKARMDQSYQTLSVRNQRGAEMVETAIAANRLEFGEVATGHGNHEKMFTLTVQSDSIVQSIVGGKVPESGMPIWLGEILAFILNKFVSPRGINFGRYSIDYHLLRNYLHMVDVWGEERTLQSMPLFAKQIVRHYVENDDQNSNIMADLKTKVLEKRQQQKRR